ncbi:TPA: hypothetical protein ACN7VA_005659, partial [Klebsiella pneumoniae]
QLSKSSIYSTKPFVGMKLRYRNTSQPPQLIHPQATHRYCAPTLLAVRCDTPEHVMVSYDELKV